MTNERKELLLVAKELRRQAMALRRRHGDDFDEAITKVLDSEPGESLKNPTVENNEKLRERVESMANEYDDPGMIMRLRAERQCGAAGLPEIAQLLADDAMRSAANGVTKETWIAEVLEGHGNDEDSTASENEEAQLACMKFIVALWTNGPWAWPRATKDDHAMGASSS